MASLSQTRLMQVLDRFDAIEARLGATMDSTEIVKLSKERAELEPVAATMRTLADARREMEDLEVLAADPEMGAMAKEELSALKGRLPELERAAQLMLLPKDEAEKASAILEIRAGTGGEEAALFAGDLFRMYARYAALHGWKVEIEDMSESELGGYREIVASVTGEGVFGRLRFESGVHRVQRVPETESGGRTHTSAATVAVLPEVEHVDIEIHDADIRIDTFRSSGAGGQHVNKTDSAVRITHMPSGIVVTSSEKSQHQNRARAMKVLAARLYDQQREKLDRERAADRSAQVGSGDRSERIRTYNFPQGRVTDHRINLTLYNLPEIMAGGALDDVVEALLAEDQAKKLAALEEE